MESQSKVLRNGFKYLKEILQKSLLQSTEHKEPSLKVVLTTIANKSKEDYVCPSAVRVFNQYKTEGKAFGYCSAKALGQAMLDNLPTDTPLVEHITINQAGFLSIKVKDSYMEQEITTIVLHGVQVEQQNQEKVLVDFSSPNIAKQMHVGHLRSTIIGESICRLLEFKGQQVMRVNHLGDWGTQFGMLIQYIQEDVGKIDEQSHSLQDILNMYKQSKKRFDEDLQFKERARQNVTKLQAYDPNCIEIWKLLTKITMKENNKLYERMDIKLEDFGESFYNKMIVETVEECRQKGLVKVDDGAECIFLEGFSTPLIVVKKDGGFNYDSTDLAAIKYRLQHLNRNRVIVLADLGQQQHFHKIFKAAQLAGWVDNGATMTHVGFGLVQGADGKKFKSRDGDTVKLQDLLDNAVELAQKDLVNRLQTQEEGCNTNLEGMEEVQKASESIGISAIKYYDLRQNRLSDYRFDYAKMLDFKGNTAVYLFYSYVRICSILTKSGLSEDQIKEHAKEGFKFTHSHEKLIGQLLVKFSEHIDQASDDLELHKLCDYTYLLTVKVAEGYSKYRILEQQETIQRVMLCLAVKRVLYKLFWILGLQPVTKI